MKDPKILILDEATSALDNESERHIQKSLEELAKNRTSITIAHRLSTIRGADEIIVIGEKGIEERGTHEELLQLDNVYARYYRRSLKAWRNPLRVTDDDVNAPAPSFFIVRCTFV